MISKIFKKSSWFLVTALAIYATQMALAIKLFANVK